MVSIGVFFSDPGFDEYPFSDPDYKEAYEELAKAVHKRGAEFFIVRGKDTYKGDNVFSSGWRYTPNGYEHTELPLHTDLIYNKGSALISDAGANVINAPAFDAICENKMRSYALFPSLFPQSVLAHNEAEASRALESMQTGMVVLKPADGWGGKKVWIGPKEEAAQCFEPYPVVVQEFIDTSGGIPGFPGLIHDFRIVVMNGEPLLTFLRVPKEGSLIANVGQGGRVIIVPPERRPAEAMQLMQIVDARLAEYGNRVYSIDCGYDASGRWLLIELNDQPGLMTRRECGDAADWYYAQFADFLLSCAVSVR